MSIWRGGSSRTHARFDELLADVEDRIRAASADEHARPGDLLELRGRPLVRAAMTSTRRRRLKALACCAGAPFCAYFLFLVLLAVPGTKPVAAWLALGVVFFWPAVCFLGAALAASGTVIAERQNDTAIQIVLTPLSKRDIAAAAILPAAWPYLWGMVAALPLYLWVAGSDRFVHGGVPTPLVLWPLRMLAPVLGPPEPGLSLPGAAAALVMCATDLAFVWSAAHWGAAYAVRVGQLPMVALLLAGRMLFTTLYVLICSAGCLLVMDWADDCAGILLPVFVSPAAERAAPLFGAAAALVVLWLFVRYFLLVMPLKVALKEFTYFDWLAFDDYRPAPLRGWSLFFEYGERT